MVLRRVAELLGDWASMQTCKKDWVGRTRKEGERVRKQEVHRGESETEIANTCIFIGDLGREMLAAARAAGSETCANIRGSWPRNIEP